jgi:hypothetical protein
MARSIHTKTALEGVEAQPVNQQNASRTRPLEEFRSYLVLLARIHLDSGPRNRIDPSDIVQQTFTLRGLTHPISRLHFSLDGHRLIAVDDLAVTIWDATPRHEGAKKRVVG